MANLLREHRLVDNSKRSLIKFVYISDSSAYANTTLVDVSTLSHALNANGYIMSSNTHPRSIYRTSIKRIFGNSKINGYIKLQWQGATNTEIITFSNGFFDFNFTTADTGGALTNPESSSNGDILISTSGAASGDTFTIFLELRKDNNDYDAGQTNDPVAFNRGPAAL